MPKKFKPTRFVRLRVDLTLVMREEVKNIPFGPDRADLTAMLDAVLAKAAELDPSVLGYAPGATWQVGLDHRPRVSREEAERLGLITPDLFDEPAVAAHGEVPRG
jgi:hypothetical protein